MIDAERMLGSLVRNAMRGGKRSRRRKRRGSASMLSRSAKGGLALGALGVAFGLYEHLSQRQAGPTTGGASPTCAGSPASLPPLPTSGAGAAAPPPLPPLPTAGAAPPEAAPPPETSAAQQEALLLVRAMIAAANADHEVDDDERARIVESLDEAGLGAEERDFVLAELESPMDLASLAAEVTSPEVADRVYLASLMAIEVDTWAEENYLGRLADRLGLDAARVKRLEGLLSEEGGEGK